MVIQVAAGLPVPGTLAFVARTESIFSAKAIA
jgi:hypothetical protein